MIQPDFLSTTVSADEPFMTLDAAKRQLQTIHLLLTAEMKKLLSLDHLCSRAVDNWQLRSRLHGYLDSNPQDVRDNVVMHVAREGNAAAPPSPNQVANLQLLEGLFGERSRAEDSGLNHHQINNNSAALAHTKYILTFPKFLLSSEEVGNVNEIATSAATLNHQIQLLKMLEDHESQTIFSLSVFPEQSTTTAKELLFPDMNEVQPVEPLWLKLLPVVDNVLEHPEKHVDPTKCAEDRLVHFLTFLQERTGVVETERDTLRNQLEVSQRSLRDTLCEGELLSAAKEAAKIRDAENSSNIQSMSAKMQHLYTLLQNERIVIEKTAASLHESRGEVHRLQEQLSVSRLEYDRVELQRSLLQSRAAAAEAEIAVHISMRETAEAEAKQSNDEKRQAQQAAVNALKREKEADDQLATVQTIYQNEISAKRLDASRWNRAVAEKDTQIELLRTQLEQSYVAADIKLSTTVSQHAAKAAIVSQQLVDRELRKSHNDPQPRADLPVPCSK